MKIYLAGSFESRDRLRPMADQLWKIGYEVVSTWLNEVARPPWMDEAMFDYKLAMKDFWELASADVVIIDTIERSSTGGSDTEFGLAISQWHKKAVLVVGPARSVFHQLADERYETWDELLHTLAELQETKT